MLKKFLFILLILVPVLSFGQKHELKLENKNNSWWMGLISKGHQMPIKNGFNVDQNFSCYGNQSQPLLLSINGDVVWSETPLKVTAKNDIIVIKSDTKITKTKGGKTLREAYLHASNTYFPPSGKIPHELLFTVPQYNTWIELMYDQNQRDIMNYAKAIVDNGFPPGVIMIDDNWQEDYGKWNFHAGRFPNPKQMMDSLHDMGFKVMLWVVPFVSPDCDIYRALKSKKAFMMDDKGNPAMVNWWNGVSAELDLSNPVAVKWFKGELDRLVNEFGADGFKLDAGDVRFYEGLKSHKNLLPVEHCREYGKIGLDYPLNEYRAMWKMGGQPLGERLHDKNHDWAAIRTLIAQMLLEGVSGYPFSCPDMIGGGQFTSFLNGAKIDQEIIVRSAQVHALMPMMQFSVAPWRVLDKKHLTAVQNVASLRAKFQQLIMDLTYNAAKTGEPIIRSMEYVFPHKGYEKITDQFLLGDRLLVAPVLENGAKVRKVILPKGKWRGFNGKKYHGGKTITVKVDLETLPYFEKLGKR